MYLLVSQKETNIWPSICATNKKNKYTNKKAVILYAYPCIGPKKSPFWQNKYTKDGCDAQKKNRLLCICVLVYRGKEITALVYNTVVRLCQFFGCDGK